MLCDKGCCSYGWRLKHFILCLYNAEAEVLFEYEQTEDDELTLKVGAIIKNVKEVAN